MKPVVFGLSHFVIPVLGKAQAQNFYVSTLGFDLEYENETTLLLKSGFVGIRLEVYDTPQPAAQMWVEVSHLPEALEQLNVTSTTIQRKEGLEQARIEDPFGNQIILWRTLTEDDLDIPPPLNTTMPWQTKAETTLQELLKSVPVAFRASARKVAVAEAEFLSQEQELESVTRHNAIRGCILSAPFFMRENLKAPLAVLDIAWQAFEDLFVEPLEDED